MLPDDLKLTREEQERLAALRRARRARRSLHPDARSRGERVADAVAATVGSWRFIIVQSALLAIWIAVNAVAYARAWDPYPFILLNLVLSFQAAYTAPIIMMSQNRQAAIDRAQQQHDYDVNVKAELEIEALHAKLDALREQEIAELTRAVTALTAQLAERRA
jgi:uncharacterized membrane protein